VAGTRSHQGHAAAWAPLALELHGGRIEAEFPDSGGSRFIVTLPCQSISHS
jgi:hypothetical protein